MLADFFKVDGKKKTFTRFCGMRREKINKNLFLKLFASQMFCPESSVNIVSKKPTKKEAWTPFRKCSVIRFGFWRRFFGVKSYQKCEAKKMIKPCSEVIITTIM